MFTECLDFIFLHITIKPADRTFSWDPVYTRCFSSVQGELFLKLCLLCANAVSGQLELETGY